MKLPEEIVVYGSFQPSVGAMKNDSNSSMTRMYYVGDNTWKLSVVIPYAGTYDYAVSTYGTLSATYYDTEGQLRCDVRVPVPQAAGKGNCAVLGRDGARMARVNCNRPAACEAPRGRSSRAYRITKKSGGRL